MGGPIVSVCVYSGHHRRRFDSQSEGELSVTCILLNHFVCVCVCVSLTLGRVCVRENRGHAEMKASPSTIRRSLQMKGERQSMGEAAAEEWTVCPSELRWRERVSQDAGPLILADANQGSTDSSSQSPPRLQDVSDDLNNLLQIRHLIVRLVSGLTTCLSAV